MNQKFIFNNGRGTKAETKKAVILSAFFLTFFLFLISFISASWTITKNSGAEKELFSVSKLTDKEICLNAKSKMLSDINILGKTYSYPSYLPVYADGKLIETRAIKSNLLNLILKNEECFTLNPDKYSYYKFGSSSIIIQLTNSYNIYPDSFAGWKYSITGNESILWNVGSLEDDEICIVPIHTDLSDVDVEVCDKYYPNGTCEKYKTIKYKYPSKIKLKDKDENTKEEIDLEAGTEEYCFPLNYEEELYYKIGEESIILTPITSYDSTDLNITQETEFAHLNVSDPNLILYMPFDYPFGVEFSNITYDFTNNSNDGTAINGASWTDDGYIGGAYTFDGVDDYVESTQVISFNQSQAWTHTAWYNWLGLSTEGTFTIFAGENSVYSSLSFRTDSVNTIRIRNEDGTSVYFAVGSSNVLYQSGWHHVAFVADGAGQLDLYIDGVLNESIAVATQMNFSSIGRAYINNNFNFNGTIDELMIWNKNLSASEVLEIYNNQSERFYPTGEMLFQNLNFSTNNTANITLQNCQTYKGSKLRAKINSGNWVNFSSCFIEAYNITGNLTSANLTIGFIAGNYNFYSSLVAENITLTSWDTQVPSITNFVNSPANNTEYNINTNHYFNATITDLNNVSNVNASIDGIAQTILNFSNFDYGFNVTSLSATSHEICWGATDTSSNVNITCYDYYVALNTSDCEIFFNETSPLTYPEKFTAYSHCTTDFSLYRNGTLIVNNSRQSLGVETYNFSVFRTDNSNYSNIYDDESFTINQATPILNMTADPQWIGVSAGLTSTITGINCPSQLTCNLFRDSDSVSNPDIQLLSVGSYNYTYNTTGNTNYTSYSTSNTLLVTSGLTPTESGDLTALYNCLIRGIGCAKDKFVYGVETNE